MRSLTKIFWWVSILFHISVGMVSTYIEFRLNGWQDGTQLHLLSVARGKYLCPDNGGGSIIVANRFIPSSWETFKVGDLFHQYLRFISHTSLRIFIRIKDIGDEKRLNWWLHLKWQLWRVDSTHFQFRVFLKQFVGVNTGGKAVAVATQPGPSETFEIVRNPADPNRIRIKASNGLFLQAKTESSVTADFAGNSSWRNDDPSVFWIRTFGTLRGEYQVTNGYGPSIAPTVMRVRKKMTPFLLSFFSAGPHINNRYCDVSVAGALEEFYRWGGLQIYEGQGA